MLTRIKRFLEVKSDSEIKIRRYACGQWTAECLYSVSIGVGIKNSIFQRKTWKSKCCKTAEELFVTRTDC